MTNVEHDRLTSAEPRKEDRAFDKAIRPKTLEDYVGQLGFEFSFDHGESWTKYSLQRYRKIGDVFQR